MKRILLFVVMTFLVGMSVNSQDLKTSMAQGPFDQVTTTVQEHAADGVLVAYPNPVIDMVTIEGSKALEFVTIVNMVGQEIEKRTVQGNSVTIDISTYKKGIYIIATKEKAIRIVKD